MPPRGDRNADYEAGLGLEVSDQHGENRRLEEFRGRNLIVYFYPKDDTPGCTVEGKEFRELHDQFTALDCAIIGVSTDSAASHYAFAQKHGFPFILLADTRGEMSRAFGVLNGVMADRSTFVLNRDLRVVRAFHDVSPRGHAQRVLDFVRTLLESYRMLGG